MENFKIAVGCIIALIIMFLGVIFFNHVVKKDEKKDEITEKYELDDYNNVPTIDKKLGEDINITQEYLLTYVTKKSGYWYESSGTVTKIKTDQNNNYITISDGNNSIIGIIDINKTNVKSGDKVYFVGSIDLKTGYLKLSKISTDSINYNSSTKINIEELKNNIDLVKSTYFIVNGYLVTEGNDYKLFNSKEDFKENNIAGHYFRIEWNGKFDYTGNQEVTIKCNIGNTYTLNNCTLIKK